MLRDVQSEERQARSMVACSRSIERQKHSKSWWSKSSMKAIADLRW